MNGKKLTPEQEREKLREHALLTLENPDFQIVYASGAISENSELYGQLVKRELPYLYNRSLNSESVFSIRKSILEQKLRESEGGNFYSKPILTDFDVEKGVREQYESAKSMVSLGDLERIIKSFSKELNFEIPSNLKNYIPIELNRKVVEKTKEKGAKKPDKELIKEALKNKDERLAYNLYQINQLYNEALFMKISSELSEKAKEKYLSQLSESFENMIKSYSQQIE